MQILFFGLGLLRRLGGRLGCSGHGEKPRNAALFILPAGLPVASHAEGNRFPLSRPSVTLVGT